MQNSLKYILGNKITEYFPSLPFNDTVCNFLSDLSKNILKNDANKKFPDVLTFAFWCRSSNITRIKNKIIDNNKYRTGIGLVFHIAPSNVPLNFAYSFVFGLLTGNSNIVKLPSNNFPQIEIICKEMKKLFKKKKYKDLKNNCFLKYNHREENITKDFSMISDARIIWGGDKTIENIKKFPAKLRNIDITFADRYSFCIIDAQSILKLDKIELKNLIKKFYNDTYLMDQNACTSPHLIVWIGQSKNINKAKKIFWKTLYETLKKIYFLEDSHFFNKFNKLHIDILKFKNRFIKFSSHENYIYRLQIKSFPKNVDQLRGKFGYFFEVDSKDFDFLKKIINYKFQTITYFGIDKIKLLNFLFRNKIKGVDRIVPIGSSLDIGFVWDGYDIDKMLTRVIDVQ